MLDRQNVQQQRGGEAGATPSWTEACVAALASTDMPTGQTPPVMVLSPRMLSFTFIP